MNKLEIMSPKQKILLIIVVILVVAGLIFLVVSGPKEDEEPGGPDQTAEDGSPQIENGKEVEPAGVEISPEEQLKRTLSSRARSFTARYGSFSSDSNFQNLYELKSKMTPSFWQEKEVYIKEAEPVATFYGISTKALSIKLIEFDPETKTEFLVSCQCQETRDSAQKVIYQDIKIVFVKVGDNWLVDNAQWQ